MNLESQKINLELEGNRTTITLSICERIITDYSQLDRFIEALEKKRVLMRDGMRNTSSIKDHIINFTL